MDFAERKGQTMPKQFLYWPQQEYRVHRLDLACGERAEVYYAHRGWAVYCVIAGACRLELGDRTAFLDGGSVLLLGPDMPYKLEAWGNAGAAVLAAEFSAAALEPLAAALAGYDLTGFLSAEPLRLLTGLPGPAQRDIRALLEKQLALCAAPQPEPAAANGEARLLLAALLLELMNLCAAGADRANGEGLAGSLRRYIAVHYAEKLDLGVLAARLQVSRWHLCHAFKAGAGQSPMDYLAQTRARAACALLEAPEPLPLEEIARRCGYSGAAQLRRSFKQATGQSPRQYRRAARERAGL